MPAWRLMAAAVAGRALSATVPEAPLRLLSRVAAAHKLGNLLPAIGFLWHEESTMHRCATTAPLRRVTAAYKAKFRNLHFNLKDEKNPDLRRKVASLFATPLSMTACVFGRQLQRTATCMAGHG